MCTILFAHDCHPRYQLIVAANRDEYYKRPTQKAAFWNDHPNLLGGRDLQQGGTWMGITTSGRFAALTNYRDPATYKRGLPSRGHLVEDYLIGSASPQVYIENLPQGGSVYNGFNLLMGIGNDLYYYSNREQILHRVDPGVHGLSNSLLDVPWTKVSRGVQALTDAAAAEEIKAEQLFTILADRFLPEDRDLPETGVGLEMERILAPVFVASPKYGTCLSTVILVERDGQVRFWERSYPDHEPGIWEEVYYEFQLENNQA